LYQTDGTLDEKKYRFLGDPSPYGILQFLMKIIAKRELVAPTNATWSIPGKKLLAFLTSHRFYVQNSFAYETGAWDSVTITGEFTPADRLPLKMEMLDTTIARAKAFSIGKTETPPLPAPSEEPNDEEYDDDTLWDRWKGYENIPSQKEGILLSEVLQVGVESFYNSAYTKSFNVEIDIMREIFKEVVIDPEAKVCMVCLNPGVTIAEERLKEDLQTETLVMMEPL
jgi:hypothetical protein